MQAEHEGQAAVSYRTLLPINLTEASVLIQDGRNLPRRLQIRQARGGVVSGTEYGLQRVCEGCHMFSPYGLGDSYSRVARHRLEECG